MYSYLAFALLINNQINKYFLEEHMRLIKLFLALAILGSLAMLGYYIYASITNHWTYVWSILGSVFTLIILIGFIRVIDSALWVKENKERIEQIINK